MLMSSLIAKNPFIRPLSDYLHYTGVYAVYAFALFAWLSTAGASIALVVFVLAFLLSPSAWNVYRRDPMFWIFVAFALFVYASLQGAVAEFPETLDIERKEAGNWLKLFAFLPFAWWVRGDLKRINLVLILATAGWLIGALEHIDWGRVLHFDASIRTGFKHGAIFSGLISATALFGLLSFAQRLWQGPYPWVSRPLLIVALYLAAFMLISCQSRGTWLAAGLVIPPALAWYWFGNLRGQKVNWAKASMPTVLILGSLAGILATNLDVIEHRLEKERVTATKLLHGRVKGVPRTSLFYRFEVQKFGLQKWLERPILGWGPGSTQYLITHSKNPRLITKKRTGRLWMRHFHNTYLDILVRLGLAGAGLLSAGGVVLCSALAGATRQGIPMDYRLFLGGSLVLLAIWCLFDFRALHPDWRAYWVILAGIVYSFRFAQRETPA
jgi:O-antigen ligase